MTDRPTLRQRILSRIDGLDDMRAEISHLPGGRVLAVDVSMTEAEHAAWLDGLLRDAEKSGFQSDGEAAFTWDELRDVDEPLRQCGQRVVHGTGAPAEIAERIARMPDGHYRFTLECMPSKAEIAERLEAVTATIRQAAAPELDGKTEDEIQEIANTWVDEAREQIRAERLQLLRRLGYARRRGWLSEDELYLLAYELVLSRFGADH